MAKPKDPVAEESAEDDEEESEEEPGRIADVVKSVIGSLLDSGEVVVKDKDEDDEPKKPARPQSPREEEDRMESLVGGLVKKFLAEDETKPKTPAAKPAPVVEDMPGPAGFGQRVREKIWGTK